VFEAKPNGAYQHHGFKDLARAEPGFGHRGAKEIVITYDIVLVAGTRPGRVEAELCALIMLSYLLASLYDNMHSLVKIYLGNMYKSPLIAYEVAGEYS
jgi:hypothetical protein